MIIADELARLRALNALLDQREAGLEGCGPSPNPPGVDAAARWLATQTPAPHPVIPALKRRFGLTAAQAVEAIREANLRRVTP